ncbi:sigma-54-dependent Fis family transcriptional regulator, partial [Pontibacterium sp.]|uniref:sigma-54-dependent Fis family transcriptional regulator n=1 Tax=Pontibacterium sp. TaxID=2036026 RepID=UPI003517B821
LNGETGTGKEVVARALHDAGPRAKKPFVAVNCAAIPEGLIESELFGYREGAFTGSRRGGMVGRFQQADGGTLFLDEIGDMPLALQARLLRVLQERRVAPLGGGEEVSLDIRLICATHRDMRALVAEGDFREDLFYRLNGVGVKLPALRDRTDLREFLTSLLRTTEQRMDFTRAVEFDNCLLDKLASYSWPGNIRQMETVLRAALAFLDDDETLITEEHLTDDFLEQLNSESDGQGNGGILKQSEQQTIRKALDENNGNISATAKALGISRATLYRRLQELEQEG